MIYNNNMTQTKTADMEVVMYGADWCADCRAAKHFFESHGIQYVYKDVDHDQLLMHEMLALTNGREVIPTIKVGDRILQEPSIKELTELFEVSEPATEQHDVVMIGAGPAALSAAIYTTREDIGTILYEKGVIGGLAATTDWVDNYPGFAKGIAGLEFADALQQQAERFGAEIRLGEVTEIIDEGQFKHLVTTDGDVYAKAVLIATGSDYKKIDVPGEKEFYARGVHYCATCDGAFYRDKRLVVVGGGNSAVQEAMFLTRFATHIDLLVRSKLRASDVLVHELKEKYADKITVHVGTTTDEIIGEDNHVTKVIGTDTATGKKVTFETDGVFIFVGLKPNTGFLKGTDVELDNVGLIKTDTTLQTNMKGVFAAGDVRSGATMQVASAAGEGATAALRIREYLEGHKVDYSS
jgi:thioredoxin reductase (NADPH)